MEEKKIAPQKMFEIAGAMQHSWFYYGSLVHQLLHLYYYTITAFCGYAFLARFYDDCNFVQKPQLDINTVMIKV